MLLLVLNVLMAIITLRKSVLVPDLTSNCRALGEFREEQRYQKKHSSIGRQGEEISEETQRFQRVVREKLGKMIVGYSSTVQSEAARCIQAIGRESPGGPVASKIFHCPCG